MEPEHRQVILIHFSEHELLHVWVKGRPMLVNTSCNREGIVLKGPQFSHAWSADLWLKLVGLHDSHIL